MKQGLQAHYVVFESPGTFVHEATSKEIDSWDVEKAKKMAKSIKERHGATPFAFYFTTRYRAEDEMDSKEVARSGRYFLGGRILDADGVKREIEKPDILLSNMRCNGWDRVVVNDNSWRVIQPLEKGDCLV